VPPLEKLSIAAVEHTSNGIKSCIILNLTLVDPILDGCDELYRYFMSYLHPPSLNIIISGDHTETHFNEKTNERESRTITDFSFSLDGSPYIDPAFHRIVAIPKPGKRQQTIKETLKDYCASNNMLKEIHLQKQLLWNFNELRAAIEWTIRSTGYRDSVHIRFDVSNSEVYAYSSSAMSKFSRNPCVQCLCFVTCLCIIFAPIYFLSRKTEDNK
jgi:hypothetical protein